MRISSSQSMSSGREGDEARRRARPPCRWARRARATRATRSGSRRKRLCRRVRPLHIGQRAGVHAARRAAALFAVADRRACRCGRPRGRARGATRRSSYPARRARRGSWPCMSRRLSTRFTRSVTSRTRPSSFVLRRASRRPRAPSPASPVGLQRDDADAGLVEAQIEQRVVELAPRADGPRVGARLRELVRRLRLGALGRAHGERRRCGRRVERERRRSVRSVPSGSSFTGLRAAGACCARPSRRAGASPPPRSPSCRAPRRRGPTRTARLPRTPSATVENTSARSRRTLRLSTRRVSPPVPGSTPRSGASGRLTALEPSSTSTISSHAMRELVAAAGRGAGERARAIETPALGAHLLEVRGASRS